MIRAILALSLALLPSAMPATAQDDGQDLGQAASDPTAPLMNFQLQESYGAPIYGLGGAAQNYVQFRTAIPFKLWGRQNIFRLTLPVFTETPSGDTGIADTVIFDLVTFDESWGRWGVGAVGLIPTGAEGLSAEKWAAGPAAGFTAPNGPLLLGLFNQNLFSFAGNADAPDVALSTLQPIVNYGLGQGWSAGTSEMTFSWDWQEDAWTSLPLGVKVNKLHHFGVTPIQFSLAYERNFAEDFGVPQNLYSFSIKVLLPKG